MAKRKSGKTENIHAWQQEFDRNVSAAERMKQGRDGGHAAGHVSAKERMHQGRDGGHEAGYVSAARRMKQG
jgi:hypothetical protein